jgi:flavin reductase (DIM6/NTAB) family NADH-FMN oxidoreductase RutF
VSDDEELSLMLVNPADLARRNVASLLNGIISPRPVAWVSTVSTAGRRNLAPFSFFNAFSTSPPTLGIGPGSRNGVNKDSLRNIRETGEFVVNMVSESLAVMANLCSAELEVEHDEWELLGIEPAESDAVAPQRVAAAPAAFECRVRQIVDLGTEELPTNSVVIATIERIHIDDDKIDGYEPDPALLKLVGRMGGDYWTRTTDFFELPRPGTTDLDELREQAVAAIAGEKASE